MAISRALPVPKVRNLYLPKQVDQASMNELTKSIIEINEDDEHLKKLYGVYGLIYDPKPIKIYIDSYGGKVYQCFGLIGVMENSLTPIHTVVTGAAMSCGFIIVTPVLIFLPSIIDEWPTFTPTTSVIEFHLPVFNIPISTPKSRALFL